MRMKKFLTFLLTLAMVVSMLPAAAFAANNTATTMRLAKTQGTVAVTNATGKKVTQTSNMKLYNGYKIKTGAKSYAWISLDNTKAAKLDANSVVSVQKNGQKLTLYLSSGNLFFNVKDPLKSGESFHIKTSTMTTGIRGTSGCVRVINDRVTEIHLLTGQVEVYTENPELNISKMAVLKAGQKATSLIAEDAMAATGKQAEIIIEQLTHEEVCGNCSKEIAADPALVERIEAEAPHLLPDKIADEAEERLEADEEKAEEKQAAIDKAVDNQTLPEDVDPYFEKEESSSGGGGGSSAPVTPSTVVSVTSWDEFVTAVNNYNSGTDNITIKVDAEIDQGTDTRTATVQPTANGNTLTIDLTTEGINMNSTIVNNGNLVVTNTAGHIITEALTVLENNGTFILDNGTLQTLVYSDVNGNSPVVVKNNGDFEMNGGAVRGSFAPQNEFASYCGVMNDGTFTMSAGTIDTVGYAIINGENAAADLMILGGDVAPLLGVQNINGTATVADGTLDGTFYNEDELIIQGGIWTASYGALVENNSTGTMTMTGGTMHILTAGGYGVSNSGTATLSGGNIYVRNGAVGVESIGTLVMNGGIRVRAYDGTTGVRAENNITLGEGAAIWAYGTATAVTLGGGDGDVYLSRPVKADIGAETETKVIVPLYPAMAVNPGATDPDTNQTMYDLVDNYGKVTDGQSLAEMIQAFNQGNIDVTIKLEGNINVNSVLPVIGSASDTKVLTIDLNGKTLTLSQPMENAGNLLIDDSAGSGSIAGTANPLISNTGNLELAGGNISLKEGQTGVTALSGTVTMSGGSIDTVDATGGTTGILANGVVDIIMKGGNINVADNNMTNSNATGIKLVNANASLDMQGGTISVTSTRTDFPGGYNYYPPNGVHVVSGSATLTGGTVKAEGTRAQAVNMAGGNLTSQTIGTDITATASDRVWIGTLPGGYEVAEATDGNKTYYRLQVAPTGINTWAELMAAVADFNAGTTDKTITLTDNIDPTDTEVASVTQLSINNVYGNTLTLDLGLNTLALPATLEVTGSSVVITADSGGDVEGTITTGQEWVNVGGPALISNEADLELAGGSIIVPTGETGVYNEGTFEMSGGYVAASGGIGIENANDATISGGTIQVVNSGIGVYSANMVTTMTGGFIDVQSGTGVTAFNPFVMEGGQIVAIGGTGLSVMGATTLTKGEITADYDAVAVSNRGTVTMGEDMTVRAYLADNVMTLTGAATLPAGYVVSAATDGEGYYHLTPSTATVPMNVSDWEGFVNAVKAFNTGTSAETITLMADIDPTAEQVMAVTQANNGVTLPAIGNATSTDLTINLGGHTLGLPATMATNSSSGLVIDGTGTITTGQQWNNSAYLINNSTDLTLKGGTIAVPHNVIGVNNTGTFEMKGGDMEILYSTGIQNAKDVILGGGTITLREDNTNYSNGGTDAIGYQAYAGIGSASTLEMDGTNITIEQGILYYFNDGNDDVYSPPAGIYNEAGTVTYTSGDMLVGTGVGISNSDTLIMNGGIITVNESATAVEDTATGIESFGGTFTMNDGAIDASRGTGLRIGGTAALKDGTVSATMYATAVESYSANVTMGEQMTIRGSEADQVYVLGTGGALPAGYEVSDTLGDDGYYHLEALYSAAAEEFVQAVNGWDGTAKTITLTESITVDYDVLYALGYDALEVPEGTGTLTIDLDTYTLTLETPLVTNSNMIVTYDGVGEGSAVYVDANEQAGIIVNGGTTQLMGGYISGSDNTPLVYVNAGGTLAVNGAGTVIVPGEGGIGITVNGGTAMVNDGIVEALGDNTIAVEVYSGTLNVSDNADIRAGNTYTNDANNYAIYDHGGTITILGGEISAYLYDTNSYALYSDQTTWNSLTVNTDNATVTGPAAANVITPTHGTYEAAQGTDYWKLQDRSGGGNGE